MTQLRELSTASVLPCETHPDRDVARGLCEVVSPAASTVGRFIAPKGGFPVPVHGEDPPYTVWKPLRIRNPGAGTTTTCSEGTALFLSPSTIFRKVYAREASVKKRYGVAPPPGYSLRESSAGAAGAGAEAAPQTLNEPFLRVTNAGTSEWMSWFAGLRRILDALWLKPAEAALALEKPPTLRDFTYYVPAIKRTMADLRLATERRFLTMSEHEIGCNFMLIDGRSAEDRLLHPIRTLGDLGARSFRGKVVCALDGFLVPGPDMQACLARLRVYAVLVERLEDGTPTFAHLAACVGEKRRHNGTKTTTTDEEEESETPRAVININPSDLAQQWINWKPPCSSSSPTAAEVDIVPSSLVVDVAGA